MNETTHESLHILLARVMKDIGAVAKDQTNEKFSYKFRGIDQVMTAMHRALTKHGVFYVPRIVGKEYATLPTKSGGGQRHALVDVIYTFYGPDGDAIEYGPYSGEGMDTSDKATNKALSAALKYLLIHGFCIPTEEQAKDDADGAVEVYEWSDGPTEGKSNSADANEGKAPETSIAGTTPGGDGTDGGGSPAPVAPPSAEQQVKYTETLFRTYGYPQAVKVCDEVARERGIGKVSRKRDAAALPVDVLEEAAERLARPAQESTTT